MDKLTINLTLPNGNKHEVAAPVTVDMIKQLEEAEAKSTVKLTEPFFPPEYLMMERYLTSGRLPIYVKGDPEIVRKWVFSIAKMHEIPCRSSIQCYDRMTLDSLLGTKVYKPVKNIDGGAFEIVFEEGDLLEAYAEGEIVCLEDFRQLPTDCMLEVAELALTDYYTCPGYNGKTYRRHPNFRLVMIENLENDKWANQPPMYLTSRCLYIKVAYNKAHEECLRDHEKMHDLFARGTASTYFKHENAWEDALVEKQLMGERR